MINTDVNDEKQSKTTEIVNMLLLVIMTDILHKGQSMPSRGIEQILTDKNNV